MPADLIDALKDAIAAGDWHRALPLLRARAELEPDHPRHWANLASVAPRTGTDPVPALRRAVLLAPDAPGYLNDLGAADRDGMTAAARLLVLAPLHGPATIMRALKAFGDGKIRLARSLLSKVLVAAPDTAEACYLLAQATEQDGMISRAVGLYRTVRVLDPADRQGAGRALARLGAGPLEAAFTPAHVKMVFDGYAENFDTHLTGRLKYSAPESLLRLARACGAVAQATPAPSVLDIGCGTGLAGAAFRPHCRHLTGIDLSGEMIRHAEAKGIYDRLLTGEVTAILQQERETYTLIIAADVTSYIGDLTTFLATVAVRLAVDGTLLLTALEPAPGEAPGIGPDGAHMHDLAMLRRCADEAGLSLKIYERGAMREEAGQPLATLFVAFTKRRQIGV